MRKINELFRSIKREFMAGFAETSPGTTLTTLKFEDEVIPVVHNHIFVHYNGIAQGMYAVCAGYTNGSHIIYVDDEYMKLPNVVKEFILWHELGHVHDTNSSNTRTIECECRADAFATKHVGKRKAIIALNHMWSNLALTNILAAADIPTRMKALGVNVDTMYIQQVDGTILHEPELRLISEGINPFTNRPFGEEV